MKPFIKCKISRTKGLILVLFLAVIVCASLYIYFNRPGPSWRTENLPSNVPVIAKYTAPAGFVKSGVIVSDNPGLQRDTFYLSYEEPGKPALVVPLAFENLSYCGDQSKTAPCIALSPEAGSAFKGKRVSVEGDERNGIVYVRKLIALENLF